MTQTLMERVDLTRARPGCVVEFRCGGKAKIISVLGANKMGVRIAFNSSAGEAFLWEEDGFLNARHFHPFDIISITDPPLTEAERLAEIAKIAREPIADWRGQIKPGVVEKILALAEGSKS